MPLPPSLVFAAVTSLSPGPACHGVVSGQVVDVTTGEAVADAEVRIADRESGVRTDADGRFTVQGLCPGEHEVLVMRADYETARRRARVQGDGRVEIDVTVEPRLVERVDDVVVVAPAPLRTETRASTTLDGEALAATRGQGLADALSRVPGVASAGGTAASAAKPIIRGQVGRRNLLLYDRIRHEGQKWGLEHAPEIDPFSAGSITVIKGAGTVRYGPDAIGGLVLVDPPPLRRDPGVSGAAHLIGTSNGLGGGGALRIEGAHARVPGFSWRVEGNANRAAALVTPDYPLDNTGSLGWNAGAKLGYLSDAFDITAGYRRYFMRAGICTCLRAGSPDEFRQVVQEQRPIGWELYDADFAIERPSQRVSHDLAMARARVAIGAAGELTTTYAFQLNRRQEFELVPDFIDGPQLDFDLRTHSVEVAFDHAPVPVGGASTLVGTAGTAFAHQRNDYTSQNPLIPDYEQWSGGLFVVERLVARQIEIEAGARYDGLDRNAELGPFHYPTMVAAGKIDPDACTDRGDGGGRCSTTFHTGSGSVGVLGRPVADAPKFVVKLDLSSSARFPAIDEQYMNGSAPSFPVLGLGDGTLGVERTWGSSLTVGHATPWIAAEGAAYVNFIQDYIYFAGVPAQGQCAPLVCNPNGAFQVFEFLRTDALFYGGELGATVAPPKWPVELQADGAWVRAHDLSNDAYLPFIPPDRYRLAVAYRWPASPPEWTGRFGLSGTFVDRQRRTEAIDLDAPPDPDTAVPPGTDFAPAPPAYFLLGASASMSFELGDQVLRVAADGANLLNTRYRDYTDLLRYYADEPGWSVRVRVSVNFEIVGAG